MLRLLIDTSVWLDLAKDYRQRPLLSVLFALTETGEAEIILPETVVEEFIINKTRVVEDSRRSLSSLFRRVREAVDTFGNEGQKEEALRQIAEVDHKLGIVGEASNDAIDQIDQIFASSLTIETTDSVKVRAADRAINGRAPCHRQRNSINDAILIETYADELTETREGVRFAFVTHNTKDFSATGADIRLPHPDIASLFSERSTYETALARILDEAAPDVLEDIRFELEYEEHPRRLSEIMEAIDKLFDQVWYNRHWNARLKIEDGTTAIVEQETFPAKDHATRPIQRDVWEKALAAAKRVEDKYGDEDLGPWTDFEWGMINGKLSALRWVLGDEWDFLDT